MLTKQKTAGKIWRRRLNFIAVSLAFGVLFLAPAPVRAAVVTDNDHDGIDDGLEQKLADLYAPLLYFEPDESNYPVNVDWFLARAHLSYHEDCFSDVDYDIGPNPVGTQLLGPDSISLWTAGANCGEGDTGCHHPPHRDINTIAADPDGNRSAGAATSGYSDQQTFVLADLPDPEKLGSTNPQDWVTYFHVYPGANGGIMIQYWHIYAYNQFGAGFDDHGGDWDASIQVQLDRNLNLIGVYFSRHADDHPGSFFPIDSNNFVRLFHGTHPVVAIDGGGHAAYRSPDDWATCGCRVLEGVTGPLGTIVWTNDADAFDDPSKLREANVCAPGNNCITSLSDITGGIVWETWTGGQVLANGSLTNPITAPSGHGGMINLGEYNPCTPLTCNGSQQATDFLSGQFYPLNNAFWLKYSGRWGSIGTINSGPRGPVFQGFEDHCDDGTDSIYKAWYNEGAISPPTNDGFHPWLVPPSTAANVGSPSYVNGNGQFITGSTPVTLTASQSTLATGFGALTTFYRFYQSGGVVPAFTTYTASFNLRLGHFALPDGVYKVDYYSTDGLGNVEPAHSFTVTLDNTAPALTIAQPQAIAYLHSATLTLGYSVTDGSGSGVASFVPKMDGLLALSDGHGLQSGPPAINLLTEMTVGPHTFSLIGTDRLGNGGSASVTFTIVVTPDSIGDDVTQFLQSGNIKNNGEANSLTAKLNAAAKARGKGDCKTAANNYNAFINELQAQSGKGVSAAAAAVMIADAQYLIDHCP